MRKTILLLFAILVTLQASAQHPANGFPPFGSFENGSFDAVNRQNLNFNFAIPIAASPGRGTGLNFSIVHDSLIWERSGSVWTPVTDPDGNPTWGWKLDSPVGYISFIVELETCEPEPEEEEEPIEEDAFRYYDFVYVDPAGTNHQFDLDLYDDPTSCNFPTSPDTGYATDGSGYYLDATGVSDPLVISPSGTKIRYDNTGPVNKSATGVNGNFISKIVYSSTENHWKDTVGRITLKIKKIGSTKIEYRVLDPNGNYQLTTLHLTNYNIKTNFGCSGVSEYTGSGYLPTSIDLPNGRSYTITYEITPGFSAYKTGRVKKVTLPTQGSYEYIYTGSNNGINCSDLKVKGLDRKINDGSTTATWKFSRAASGSNWITTVDAPKLPYDPMGNRSKFTFNSSGRLTKTQIYQGTSTLKRTVNTTWAANGTPASTTVILEDNKQSKTETTFDTYGNLTLLKEYDWDSSTPTRTTQLTYESGSAYTSRNIRNRLTQQLVRAGGTSGTIKSRTDISYDETTYSNNPTITDAAQHDNVGYGGSFYTRGNPTSITSYTSPAGPSGGVTRHFTYDSLGNLRKADLDCCQQREWKHQKSTSEYAYPYEAVSGPTAGPQLTVKLFFNTNTGLVTKRTDENNQDTIFEYDVYGRITKVKVPNPAQGTIDTITAYDDDLRTITTDIPIQGTDKQKQRTYFDQLGRSFKQCTLNGSSSIISCSERQYDVLSRGYKVSNPFTGSAADWTETRFDALGRPTLVIQPGNAQTSYAYSGNTVTVTDPTSKQRKNEADALGRLFKVYEPDVASGNSLTQLTTNTYDVLDRLTQVAQGSQTRTFVYDGLGRLTSQTTPEAGTVSFVYNSHSLMTQRTDARSISKNFTYDGLNRLTQASYTDSTPTVSFTYGTSAASYNKGRLITVTYNGSSNTESFTYDKLGRVTQATKKIDNVNYPVSYAYNLASELSSITYPSGRVVTQTFDSIGRLSQIKNGSTNYANGFAYNTAQQVTAFNYGNGVAAAFTFSAQRLQLTSLKYTKGANTLFHTTYGYTQNGGNNGQITSITDNVDSSRSLTYNYDALGRLKEATAGPVATPTWKLNWDYDRYGNRKNQNVVVSPPPPAIPPTAPQLTIDPATNHITDTGFSYDAAGNLTNDALNTYTYDGENRIKTKSGGTSATYYYDGASLRVKKVAGSTTTRYIFSGTKVIAEYDNGAAVGSPTKEYIYSGSQLLVTLTGSTPTYHHSDHLSVRVNTNSSGTTVGQQGHYPFGESWYSTSTTTKWQFTSYERDSESGLDYAMFRYDNSRLGRFMTPDPIAGSIFNPQSLNRYAYVLNDPINLVDPFGLSHDPIFGDPITQCFVSDPRIIGGIGDIDAIIEDCLGDDANDDDEQDFSRDDGDEREDDVGGGSSSGGHAPREKELKKALKKVLKKAECAALVGGQDNAQKMLGNLSITDVSASGWVPQNAAERSIGRGINSGDDTSGVLFSATGGPVNIYVGAQFNSFGLSGQATVIIHEMMHVSARGLDRLNVDVQFPSSRWPDSIYDIARKCGTDVP